MASLLVREEHWNNSAASKAVIDYIEVLSALSGNNYEKPKTLSTQGARGLYKNIETLTISPFIRSMILSIDSEKVFPDNSLYNLFLTLKSKLQYYRYSTTSKRDVALRRNDEVMADLVNIGLSSPLDTLEIMQVHSVECIDEALSAAQSDDARATVVRLLHHGAMSRKQPYFNTADLRSVINDSNHVNMSTSLIYTMTVRDDTKKTLTSQVFNDNENVVGSPQDKTRPLPPADAWRTLGNTND